MSKETGLICTGESVRAILDGRKTQTRRVIKPQPVWVDDLQGGKYCIWLNSGGGWYCPVKDAVKNNLCSYGKVGDKLWVKEATITHVSIPELRGYVLDGAYASEEHEKYRSPRFMFKAHARIWLEITRIRVERIQEIDNNWEDCLKEGVVSKDEPCCDVYGLHQIVLFKFIDLWNSINAKRGYGWDKNCWVWIIEFRSEDEQ